MTVNEISQTATPLATPCHTTPPYPACQTPSPPSPNHTPSYTDLLSDPPADCATSLNRYTATSQHLSSILTYLQPHFATLFFPIIATSLLHHHTRTPLPLRAPLFSHIPSPLQPYLAPHLTTYLLLYPLTLTATSQHHHSHISPSLSAPLFFLATSLYHDNHTLLPYLFSSLSLYLYVYLNV